MKIIFNYLTVSDMDAFWFKPAAVPVNISRNWFRSSPTRWLTHRRLNSLTPHEAEVWGGTKDVLSVSFISGEQLCCFHCCRCVRLCARILRPAQMWEPTQGPVSPLTPIFINSVSLLRGGSVGTWEKSPPPPHPSLALPSASRPAPLYRWN